MTTLYLSHSAALEHQTPTGHPERPDRIRAIERALEDERFSTLLREQAPIGDLDRVALAHPEEYVAAIREAAPREGLVRIDADTVMSPGTIEAVLRGGGGDRATALGYVNALRARAGAPAITDAQLTLDFILDERARELFWEGHRRTDLVRFGRFTGPARVWQWKGNVQPGTATDAKYNLYPLPASELIANPGLQQNPGY